MKENLDIPPRITDKNAVVSTPAVHRSIPRKLVDAVPMLEGFINKEMHAHYFYASAASYCRDVGYPKAAAYFEKESRDEFEHASGLIKYLNDWNVQPKLGGIQPPKCDFTGLVDAIESAYVMELELLDAYNQASMELLHKDLTTFDKLQEYRNIQFKSVAESSDLLNKLELIDKTDRFQLVWFEEHNF